MVGQPGVWPMIERVEWQKGIGELIEFLHEGIRIIASPILMSQHTSRWPQVTISQLVSSTWEDSRVGQEHASHEFGPFKHASLCSIQNGTSLSRRGSSEDWQGLDVYEGDSKLQNLAFQAAWIELIFPRSFNNLFVA